MSRGNPSELEDDNREPSLNDTLDAIRTMDSPMVTTTDIRILLGSSTDTARRHLETLFEKGHVDYRKTNQQTLWWETSDSTQKEHGTAKKHRTCRRPQNLRY